MQPRKPQCSQRTDVRKLKLIWHSPPPQMDVGPKCKRLHSHAHLIQQANWESSYPKRQPLAKSRERRFEWMTCARRVRPLAISHNLWSLHSLRIRKICRLLRWKEISKTPDDGGRAPRMPQKERAEMDRLVEALKDVWVRLHPTRTAVSRAG